MSISSDEVNYLVYRYLQENGFSHSAFCFAHESLVVKSSVAQSDVPPGALLTFLQKGLEYVGIEEHINEDGSIREFDSDYSLLSPFVCQAIGIKEERRLKKTSVPPPATPMEVGEEKPQPEQQVEFQTNLQQSAIVSKRDSGVTMLQIQAHQGEVFMCLWNPRQAQLASGSADGSCRLWGPLDMAATKAIENNGELPLEVAVMPHSNFIGERYKDVTSVNWSPDGSHLATGCYDGIARVWDSMGHLKTELQEHNGPVFSLKWSRNGEYILSGSYDRRAIVWNPMTGEIVRIFHLHDAPVLDVDWSNSDMFATCSSDKTIRICKVSSEAPEPYCTFVGHEDEVNSVCWAPGGHLLASCSDDSTAKVWVVDEGQRFDLRGHEKEIYTVRWTPGGPGSAHPENPLYLCTASFDGTVKIWSSDNGTMVFNLKRHAQPVYSLAPNPSGDVLATGSLGGFVALWSLKDGTLMSEMRGNGDTFDVSWSYDGRMLCSCFSSGYLNIMHLDHLRGSII